jgi:hypothetical protein
MGMLFKQFIIRNHSKPHGKPTRIQSDFDLKIGVDLAAGIRQILNVQYGCAV